jgi:predicted membrane metal-binding protein
VAVVGIALWFPLLYSRIRSERRFLNRVWSLVLVGVCATVAVLPLVAYVFGRVSLLGVVMGPLLVVLAQITIVVGLLWCALPVEALCGVFRAVLGASVGWQNDIVGAVARLPFCAVEWRPSILTVVLIYLAMLAATICLWRVARGRKTQKITFE